MNRVIPSYPVYDPAWSIVNRFGAPNRLAVHLGVHPSTVARWFYAPGRGSGGVISTEYARRILDLAHWLGVRLDPAEFFAEPRRVVFDDQPQTPGRNHGAQTQDSTVATVDGR